MDKLVQNQVNSPPAQANQYLKSPPQTQMCQWQQNFTRDPSQFPEGFQQFSQPQIRLQEQILLQHLYQQHQQQLLYDRHRQISQLLQGVQAASQKQYCDSKVPVVQNQHEISANHTQSTIIVKEESQQQQFQPPQNQDQMLDKLTIVKDVSRKKELEQLLKAIVQNLGCQNLKLDHLKSQILQKHPDLTKVYELLLVKYQSQKKSREEIIKYIMRKAFKFLFKSVQKNSQENLSLKKVTKICLDHYFQDQDEDRQILILPFRKNSNIKTMNTSFLEKIFSSPKFVNDYKIFLNNFEEIIMQDNEKKIQNIAQNIQKFIYDNQLNKIKTMRRMPWTIENLKSGKQVAEKILSSYKFSNQTKIDIKQQEKTV